MGIGVVKNNVLNDGVVLMNGRTFRAQMATALVSLMLYAALVSAETLTFDNISATPATSVPKDYGGLSWSYYGWGVMNPASYAAQYGSAGGYLNGMVSCCNVAYGDSGGAPNSSSPATIISSLKPSGFNLIDGDFSAAWNNGLQVTATATLEDGASVSKVFTVNTSGPTDVVFGLKNVESIYFTTSGGTPAGYPGSGTEFVLDNLTVTHTQRVPVRSPELDSQSMAAALTLLLGWVAVLTGRKKSDGQPRTIVPSG